MTAGAWALLGVAAAFAVGDWFAVGTENTKVEYVCKPAATSALLAMAAVLSPDDSGQRTAFVVALALSLIGDVALMVPGDRFIVGLGAFLFAHVAFVIGFAMRDTAGTDFLNGAFLIAAPVLIFGTRILRTLRRNGTPELIPPVVLYILAIAAMVTSAIAVGSGYAIAGALLFFASDSLIAEQRFVAPRPFVPVLIMITYHLAQAGLVVSLVK